MSPSEWARPTRFSSVIKKILRPKDSKAMFYVGFCLTQLTPLTRVGFFLSPVL